MLLRSLEEYAGGTIAREQVGLWRDGFRRLRRNRLALVALVYLAILMLAPLVAIFWTPYNPATILPNTLTYLGPLQRRIYSAPTTWDATS